MRDVFSDVLTMSLAGGAAYVLLKLVSLLGGGRLSQRWRYGGLLAVGTLFVLPFQRLWALVPRRVIFAPSVSVSAGVAGTSGQIAGIAAAVWLIAASGLIVHDLCKLALTKRTLVKSAVPVGDGFKAIADDMASRMRLRVKARLFVSPLVQSPVLTGFFRPVVMLPRGEWSEEELRLILAHEFTHFRRHDLWKKLFFTLLRRVHWFNPLAYLMCRDFAYRMETACDERVVRSLDREGRRGYGALLIDCAPNLRREAEPSFAAFASSRKRLERRIKLMLNSNKSNKETRTIFGAVMTVVLLAMCVAATALAAGDQMTGDEGRVSIDTSSARAPEDFAAGEKLKIAVIDVSDCDAPEANAPEGIRIMRIKLETGDGEEPESAVYSGGDTAIQPGR